MSRAAILALAAIAVLCALVALVLPNLRGLALVLGSLLALSVVGSYFQARMHLKRYVMEECQANATQEISSRGNLSNKEHT